MTFALARCHASLLWSEEGTTLIIQLEMAFGECMTQHTAVFASLICLQPKCGIFRHRFVLLRFLFSSVILLFQTDQSQRFIACQQKALLRIHVALFHNNCATADVSRIISHFYSSNNSISRCDTATDSQFSFRG